MNTEKLAQQLYRGRLHQDESTGELDETQMQPYIMLFHEYFYFNETHQTGQTQARADIQRNIRVNRSLIGQQPALSSNDTPTLNGTI